MRLIKICFGISLAGMLIFNGCDNFLNVNENPNSPENAPVRLQVPALLGGFAFEFYGNMPSIISATFTQQLAHNGDHYYWNIDWYQLGQPWNRFDGVWNSGYTTVGENARTLYMQAAENGYSNYEGIGKLMFVWSMSLMTDTWGEIPYSGAFNPSDPTPPYDPQEEIYPKLMNILDEAIMAFEEEADRNPGSNDLLYGGDMEKWTRLAYTLKARLLMRLTEAPDNNKQQRASDALDALSKGFQSNDDNATFIFQDENGGRNPWNRTLDEAENLQMSAHYIDMLKSKNDPRLSIHAQEASQHDPGEEYVGYVNGGLGTSVDSVSSIGTAFAGPAAPLRLIDYAEAKFLEAQALLITQGPGAANSAYEAAIRADMEDLGASDDAMTTYIDNQSNLSTSSSPLKDIVVQKYIANFLNPEVWNDWRKTGYPVLSPSQNPDNEAPNFNAIPRRYPWPRTEIDNNVEELEKLDLPLGADVMLETVWWDTRGSGPIVRK